MRVKSTNGVTVALHDLGGDGEPLLISHATGFCGWAYQPLGAALRRHFHVWAIDLRGHGESTAPADGDFSWTGMADDIMAAADAIGLESFGGFGHSMGGAALLLAEAARPGLLRFAYLFEPIVLPAGSAPMRSEHAMSGRARRRREVFASKAEALRRYATRPPLNVMRADALAAYVEHGFEPLPDGGVRLRCDADSEARTFDAGMAMTTNRIRGLTVPTTVAIGGRTGEPYPDRLAPGIVASLTTATLVEYPHVGHFGPFQDPDTVADDIVRLAARRSSAG